MAEERASVKLWVPKSEFSFRLHKYNSSYTVEHSRDERRETIVIIAPQALSTLHYSFIGNMEKFNFGYSVKNIPIPSEREYKIQLTEKIEAVIKRMRWKAIHADGKTEETETKRKTYRLRSKWNEI